MDNKRKYCSFGDYMVVCDSDKSQCRITYKGKILAEQLGFMWDEARIAFLTVENCFRLEAHGLCVKYECDLGGGQILIESDEQGVTITTQSALFMTGFTVCDSGWKAMSTEVHDYFRTGYGNPCTALDDFLFERETDSALFVEGDCGKRFGFDYEQNCYRLCGRLQGSVRFRMEEHLYENKYHIPYSPMNPQSTFSRPPVGWMTWYAVKFDASEKTVLENTRWMAKNLKKYGADAVWVDWEWYHKDMKGMREDGCDTFRPDQEKYPNGLKYLSDEIRKLGCIPNLWVGFTNDPGENDYVKEHPEIVLVKERQWCGQYFFDFSHPNYLQEFLPRALKQVEEWGYEAVKYDTLPMSISRHEIYHDRMYDPEMTTKDAFRGMVKTTREVLGKNRYLLSCCGSRDSDVLWACDLFDAARVGGDIFAWEEFVSQGIGCTARYYPFHNVVFYNDPDNVVIREEFNNEEQARSRVAFVSMLGLPFTMGDHLPALPRERVQMIKQGIPVLDIHPVDLNRIHPGECVVTDLAVGTAREEYHVVSVLNTTDAPQKNVLDLKKMGMEDKALLGFEFYEAKPVDVRGGMLEVCLKPFETKVFAIRRRTGIPQIVSTSAHLSQGACELLETSWEEQTHTLRFGARLVEEESYGVYLYIPDGYEFHQATVDGRKMDCFWVNERILCCEFLPDTGKEYEFGIFFRTENMKP